MPRMMIPYDDFGCLRLAGFLPNADLAHLEGWEFQDHVWLGEAVGFSEWLRLEDDPEVLRSLAIDFSEFPPEVADLVLQTIALPVRAGMSLRDLDDLLGPRVAEYRFVADRVTCEYLSPEPHRYCLSCTVLNDGGLSYLVVMVPLNRQRQT